MTSQSYLPNTTKNSTVLRTSKLSDTLPSADRSAPLVKSNKQEQNLTTAQEVIWRFFLELVKKSSPELVLSEFEQLFVNPGTNQKSEVQQALNTILTSTNEQEFRNTLKRCVYILINTWVYGRKYRYAQDLIERLSHSSISYRSPSLTHRCLRSWLSNFINSEDYQEVKLFASKYENRENDNWKFRYTSYLLAPQYLNSRNSTEQRQAARRLANQLQDKFKFDLAMYTAHCPSVPMNDKKNQNPTALGDEALRLVKTVLAKRGFFNYTNLANIFLNQTQQLSYKCFKKSLLRYLIFSLENTGLVETIKTQVTQKLEALYEECNEEQIRSGLMLRTCNRVLEYLTTEKNGEPSTLFSLIASQGNPLTLAILILKILLISPSSRTYLELCIAKLVQYYEGYSQEECQWVINFLEVCKIILAIYTENIQYNLVNMENSNLDCKSISHEDGYRIFSQSK